MADERRGNGGNGGNGGEGSSDGPNLEELGEAEVLASDTDGTRRTRALDMRALMAEGKLEGGLEIPRRADAVRVPEGDPALLRTDLDGHEPIRRSERAARVLATSRRSSFSRTLPLAVVAVFFVAGLGFAGWRAVTTPVQHPTEEPLTERVSLPAQTVTLGLSEDNKNAVLQACYRVSDNPNHECRQRRLEEIGELPERQVTFGPQAIDRFEVANADYERCVAEGACADRDRAACRFYTHRGWELGATVPERVFAPTYPAVCVTREQAERFCAWRGGRLPTGDEWERVARTRDDRLAPWGALWAPDVINWAETDMGGFPIVGRLDGYDLTAPVDAFENGASHEGVHNLLGNASEWVAGDDEDDRHRGGSYTNDLRNLRVSYRRSADLGVPRSDIGFRCLYDE